jgi:hypothetical protein
MTVRGKHIKPISCANMGLGPIQAKQYIDVNNIPFPNQR